MSEEEIIVTLDSSESQISASGTFKGIYRQLTAGVGFWGSLKPIIALSLSAIPFLFLGQHFNRQHRKGRDWFLLQIPLLITLFLWPPLYLWSIFDAWKCSSDSVISRGKI